jgi:hypothetical protein
MEIILSHLIIARKAGAYPYNGVQQGILTEGEGSVKFLIKITCFVK